PHRSPLLVLLLLTAGSPLPSASTSDSCRRPAVEQQLAALLDSALDASIREVRLSLTGVAIIGLSDRGTGSAGSRGGVLQWSGSFLLAWNDTKSVAAARKNKTESANIDWAPEIGVESGLSATNNASIADIWSQRHASTRAVRPNGEVTLRFRAALRTQCRVMPGSSSFPFDTRRCDLRLGRQRRSRRRLRLLLSNASLLVAGSSSWSVTKVRVLRRRKRPRRQHRVLPGDAGEGATGSGGWGGDVDDEQQLFRLEVARALAYYWILAALPLATALTAAAAAALALRLAGSRESGQRCLDCGCVAVGCCLLLLGQAFGVLFNRRAAAGREVLTFERMDCDSAGFSQQKWPQR
uniref:Neur_chan_LBD domain-containing protein n=1 Tax=Macrostomum lignano TaxID=282301 RepID=A0A1I8HJU0_9PLAT